ncbi:MAG TPA: hypothetical protein VGC79_09475 [Polyangiaceae bacterium]
MCKLKTTPVRWLLAACALFTGACHARPSVDLKLANKDTFTRGMVAYLAAHGELCLGKEFPLDVTEREFQLRSRNALQMPALEHLGLVTSSAAMGQVHTEDGPVATPVTRFQLTETGRQYYRTRAPAPAGEGQPPHGDLCVAQLSLDQVVSFELSAPKDATSAVVKYTYHVKAAPWTAVPEIKAVFPAVARVVDGASSALLEEGFTWTKDGWLANELLTVGTQAVARNGAR